MVHLLHRLYGVDAPVDIYTSVAEWLACWTQEKKGPGSNRSRHCASEKAFSTLTSSKVKYTGIAVRDVTRPHRYGSLHAIWDHSVTCHPAEATQNKANSQLSMSTWHVCKSSG